MEEDPDDRRRVLACLMAFICRRSISGRDTDWGSHGHGGARSEQPAAHACEVALAHAAVAEGLAEVRGGGGCTRKQEDSRDRPIQPMEHVQTTFAIRAASGRLGGVAARAVETKLRTLDAQDLDERVAPVAARVVHGHACRFIQRDKVVLGME